MLAPTAKLPSMSLVDHSHLETCPDTCSTEMTTAIDQGQATKWTMWLGRRLMSSSSIAESKRRQIQTMIPRKSPWAEVRMRMCSVSSRGTNPSSEAYQANQIQRTCLSWGQSFLVRCCPLSVLLIFRSKRLLQEGRNMQSRQSTRVKIWALPSSQRRAVAWANPRWGNLKHLLKRPSRILATTKIWWETNRCKSRVKLKLRSK